MVIILILGVCQRIYSTCQFHRISTTLEDRISFCIAPIHPKSKKNSDTPAMHCVVMENQHVLKTYTNTATLIQQMDKLPSIQRHPRLDGAERRTVPMIQGGHRVKTVLACLALDVILLTKILSISDSLLAVALTKTEAAVVWSPCSELIFEWRATGLSGGSHMLLVSTNL
ncbi:hypothetical protein PROFUN_04475 [Planoprotostelium fungivorum]|uniref:Uncharacterized protein n=1 Tax=Planoprotostelium fungivorum TaxID=1890364 RepID=A0A2P6NVQ2_9EUKA|nr:hypothetical protein PROFUN_04475 [Planoprotostelium fungivorum]